MKKSIKKILSKITPKGKTKERIKLFYYRLFTSKYINFNIVDAEKKVIYKTTYQNITLLTNEALYPIVDDFKYYQHFYKVKPNDVIIDAGANCGHLSIYFSKIIGQNGKVFAFEPDKLNINRILNNIKLNPNLFNTINIEELLLWNKNEIIDFCETGTVSSSAIWMPNENYNVKKQAITIDTWVDQNKIQKINFIKMDIEGAELEALDGCIDTIQKFQPSFAIASYHIVNNQPTYIKVEEFFKKLNYPFKTVRFRGNEIITFAGLGIS